MYRFCLYSVFFFLINLPPKFERQQFRLHALLRLHHRDVECSARRLILAHRFQALEQRHNVIVQILVGGQRVHRFVCHGHFAVSLSVQFLFEIHSEQKITVAQKHIYYIFTSHLRMEELQYRIILIHRDQSKWYIVQSIGDNCFQLNSADRTSRLVTPEWL